MALLCREFGISRVTGYKVFNRYKACGLDGLYDLNSDEIHEPPDVVVLGFDMTLTYRRARKAAELVQSGLPFVATHPDPVCPTEDGLIPDCGSMVELLVPAGGRRPAIIGKPHGRMADAALARLGTRREETALIGDLLATDFRMAQECGLLSILVLSGKLLARI